MQFKRFDVTFHTEKMEESKRFYRDHFGFAVTSESEWYIELYAPENKVGISFVRAQREDGEFFAGGGVILSFEVDDVYKEHDRLVSEGLHIVQEIEDKPWGEKSFVVNDPNGVHVYIYDIPHKYSPFGESFSP